MLCILCSIGVLKNLDSALYRRAMKFTSDLRSVFRFQPDLSHEAAERKKGEWGMYAT